MKFFRRKPEKIVALTLGENDIVVLQYQGDLSHEEVLNVKRAAEFALGAKVVVLTSGLSLHSVLHKSSVPINSTSTRKGVVEYEVGGI